MRIKLLALLILTSFVSTGCTTATSNAAGLSDSTSEGSSSSSSGTSGDESSSQSDDVTSHEDSLGTEDTSSTEEVPPSGDTTDLGVKTISEFKALCDQYVTSVNEGGVGVNKNYTVTIKATAIDLMDMWKNKAPYSESSRYKTTFADQTGYLVCAGDSLYASANNSDYAMLRTSGYTLKGYFSKYFNKPELYVTEFQYDKNLSIGFDIFASAKEKNLTLESLYSKFETMPYNMSGYGYDEIYTLNNIKVLEKAETDQYLATDGYRVIKLLSYKNRMSPGSIYNVAGMITTNEWRPAIRIVGEQRVSDESVIASFPTDYTVAKPLTITNLKKIKSSEDETTTRMNSFIASFQYLYKADVYVSYYVKSSKYYVTLSDNKYTGSNIPTQESAHHTYGMVDLENSSCWNKTESDMTKFSVLKDYIDADEPVELTYSLWQSKKVAKPGGGSGLSWKVYVVEGLL